MSKLQTPKKPKQPKQKTERPFKRDYLPMLCRGIMGGCTNCGGWIYESLPYTKKKTLPIDTLTQYDGNISHLT